MVALTFSQPVNPDSIKASEFGLTGGGANYAIKEAKVVGNQVLLTLADSNAHLPQTTSVDYKVSVSAGTANGITYKAVDDFGRTLNADSVNFTLPSASQVSATYNAGVLNVKATDSNKPATGKVRVVASDAAATLTVGNSNSQNGVLEFTATGSDDIAVKAPSGTSLTVYYNGVESTVYVK